MRLVLALCVLAAPALAECPPASDLTADAAPLLERLAVAPDEAEARVLMDELWRLWTAAPDEAAQALLDDGMERRESYDFLAARALFGRLVDYCPDYAEGYNQRAFAAFLVQDYEAALDDLDTALALNPDHVAALSGRALTLMGLGRMDEGQAALRAALALNPWLGERAMLIELPGEDI
ncbi:hypothetical protein GCM10011392_28450 [Wenxinia marina]|uniref:tetratricopeptide repeat protein n=1 Tax=Wenxinia marina TaxID=390641 RepID=UPI0003829A0C|nr:tetratricopeptide repeat protein [Wenxinia marina]GGL72220.1 hypothetical protein GCM10011392_28450 [Wenxinia marina]